MMKRLILVLVALALAGCATPPRLGFQMPPGPPERVQPLPVPPLDVQVNALMDRLFIMVEEQRHRLNRDARPLALDPELTAAAQSHSDDMARKGSFDTENPDGNVAVNALLADPKFRGYVGEIAAAQYFTPGAAIDPDKYARGFLMIWINSPDHRMNLTYSRFERTGIGVAVSGNTIYAAALFATDLGLPEPQ